MVYAAVVLFLKKTAYIVPTHPDQGIVSGSAMRLTKTVIDHISPPANGQAFYRDDTLKGFAVRVTPGGAKSFIVETRVRGRMRRETLGRYGPLTVEQARREAQKYLGQVATGVDPRARAREASARAVTLQEVFEEYCRTRSALKASTLHDYRRIVFGDLKDWLNRPIAQISKTCGGGTPSPPGGAQSCASE
jgi:hypothetical protein